MLRADSSSIAFCMFVVMFVSCRTCYLVGEGAEATRDVAEQAKRIADSLEKIEKRERPPEEVKP